MRVDEKYTQRMTSFDLRYVSAFNFWDFFFYLAAILDLDYVEIFRSDAHNSPNYLSVDSVHQ